MDTLFDEDRRGSLWPSPARDLASTRRARQTARDGQPLAVRVRPRSLEEFVGQSHLLGADSALRTAIEQGRPHSMVLYGPPGLGQDDARADRRRALAAPRSRS